MLFYSFFKTLVGKQVAVELKNDLAITGTLHSVDQYLNIKLSDIDVVDKERFPQLLSVKNIFVRVSQRQQMRLGKKSMQASTFYYYFDFICACV